MLQVIDTAHGGDLRQGFAAARDGPRTITRWTSGLRAAMNAAEGHSTPLPYLGKNGRQYVVIVSSGVNAFALE